MFDVNYISIFKNTILDKSGQGSPLQGSSIWIETWIKWVSQKFGENTAGLDHLYITIFVTSAKTWRPAAS